MQTKLTPASRFASSLRRFTVDDLEQELAQVEAQQAQLNAHADLLRVTIKYKLANGEPRRTVEIAEVERTPPPQPAIRRPQTVIDSTMFDDDRLSLRDAIMMVMRERPEQPWWLLSEVYTALEERGLQPDSQNPKSHVSARLSKMSQKGDLVQRGRPGQIRYALPTMVDPALLAETSRGTVLGGRQD